MIDCRTLRALPSLLVLLLLLAAVVCPVACSNESTACFPGDYRACPCGNDVRGLEQCSAVGDAYGACDCSGKLPSAPDAGAAPTTDAATDGGLLPFMSQCTMDSECDTGKCFPFNAKGPRCTKACTMNAECPAPSTGCNMMGICKAP